MVLRNLIFIYFLVGIALTYAMEHPGETQYDDFVRDLNHPRISRENWFIWYDFNEENPGAYHSPLAFFLAHDMADYSLNFQRLSEKGFIHSVIPVRIGDQIVLLPASIEEEEKEASFFEDADKTVSEGEGEDPFEVEYESLRSTMSDTDSDAHSGSTEVG